MAEHYGGGGKESEQSLLLGHCCEKDQKQFDYVLGKRYITTPLKFEI